MRKLWVAIASMFILVFLWYATSFFWIFPIPIALLWCYGLWVGNTQLDTEDWDEEWDDDWDLDSRNLCGSLDWCDNRHVLNDCGGMYCSKYNKEWSEWNNEDFCEDAAELGYSRDEEEED